MRGFLIMKADFAKHFTGGALRNLKKVKSRKIKYDENIISFTLDSKIGRKKLGKFKCTFARIKDGQTY